MHLTNTSIFTSNNSPTHIQSTATQLRQYMVQVGGIGGEMVIGRLSNKVADYWADLNHEELGEHLITNLSRVDMDVDGNRIDPFFSKEFWADCDDVLHVNGPVYDREMKIDVSPEEGPDVFSARATHRSLKPGCIDTDTVGVDPTARYLMGRKGAYMHQIYGLEIDRAFDHRQLSMSFSTWGRLRVLNGMSYNGVALKLMHQCHSHFDDKPMAVIVRGRAQ